LTSTPESSQAAAVGRPPNTLERRAQIVDALLAVMAREGYAHATTARIAAEAGLAPGLVHYHFGSKEEILVAAITELVLRVEARASARLAAAADSPRARLRAFVDAHVALGPDADARAVAAWVVIGAEAVRQPEVRALYARALTTTFERVRSLVRDALKGEGRTTRNAGNIAAAVVSSIEGAYRLGVATPDLMPKGYAARTLRRILDGLLSAEPLR
jgi:TetR/AcrR family transcriptional repressor of bet genes